MYYTYGQIRQS